MFRKFRTPLSSRADLLLSDFLFGPSAVRRSAQLVLDLFHPSSLPHSAAVGSSTKLKVPPVTAAADATTTMSSPRGVEFLHPRLESIAVSAPKPKRAKHITMPPEPEPIITCTNLQDLPDDLLAHALAFLPPDTDRPLRTKCAAVVVSQVSKPLRMLALSNNIWVGICITRWKSKVGFVTRLANTEAEAKKDTTDAATSLIRGGFWYSKFVLEEQDALRPTISRDELRNTTFSIKLWFQSQFYPDMKRIKGAVASGLDGRSLSDTVRFDSPSGTMLGMSNKQTNGTPFFVNDDGSIINIRKSFETGTHSQFSLHIYRREDWGWELRSQIYVLRSVENENTDGLWTDYTSSLIIEKRKKGVLCTRRGSGIKYKRREVPDVEEIKEFLEW